MSLTVVRTTETDADRKWGYRFGVDGLKTLEESAEMLKCSTRTVERRIADDSLRAGHHAGRTVLCLRCLTDYIASLEK